MQTDVKPNQIIPEPEEIEPPVAQESTEEHETFEEIMAEVDADADGGVEDQTVAAETIDSELENDAGDDE